MDAVAARLYVGSVADACTEALLAEAGIDTIVSLTHSDPADGYPESQQVVTHPMMDGPQCDRGAFHAAVDDVRQRLATGDECVLVHCQAGASRSPTVAATALAVNRDIDLTQAFERVATQRDATDPHRALVRLAADVYSTFE